ASAFMFDIDGTLLHRGPDGRGHPQPGAVDVLQRIRASGRKLVLFTNGSHVPSPTIAQGLLEDGLHVTDDELLTPVDSATAWLTRQPERHPVHAFATAAAQEFMRANGVPVSDGEDAGAVFVAHLQDVAL